MTEFWQGVLTGGGAVVVLGYLCRAALHAAAERRYRDAYMSTLSAMDRERLINFEGHGAKTWRQFREQEMSGRQ